MKNWITDMFGGMDKKAELTNQEQEFERKVEANDWIKDTMNLPEEPVIKEAAYFQDLNEEAQQRVIDNVAAHLGTSNFEEIDDYINVRNDSSSIAAMLRNDFSHFESDDFKYSPDASKKTAAYEVGDTCEDTIDKDYKLALSGMSDYNLAEMLADLKCSADLLATLDFNEEKEKIMKSIGSNRKSVEKKILDILGKHTLVDWKEAFKNFEDVDHVEPSEADLYDKMPNGKWRKKITYAPTSDKEKIEQMEGVGGEEEKGALAKDASLKTAEELPVEDHKEEIMEPKTEQEDVATAEDIQGHLVALIDREAGEGEKDEVKLLVDALIKVEEFLEKEIPEAAEEAKGETPKEEESKEEPKMDEVEASQKVAVAPEGWEGTVKEMKHKKKITNPWALAWYMKNKGYHSHASKEAGIEVKAFRAGDKAYYYGKPASIKDMYLNSFSGDPVMEIECEGKTVHVSGKDLKNVGSEPLMEGMEHKEGITPEITKKDEIAPTASIEDEAAGKKKTELDNLVQKAVYGWQIPMMKLTEVFNVAKAAYEKGEDVKTALDAFLPTIGATRSDVHASQEEISTKASRAEVIKKFALLSVHAEIDSPWAKTTNAKGEEIIARVAPTLREKKSKEKNKKVDIQSNETL